MAVLLGGVLVTPALLANALDRADQTLQTVAEDHLALLAEMADTIIPDTDTPGAKAAKVQEYIAVIVQDCFPPERRDAFWRDLAITDQQCKALNGKGFVDCNADQRTAFFNQLQQQAKEQPAFTQVAPFWTTLKDLTLNGYFTSEIGATQALNYDPIPGGWIPDMPIDENTKAWTPVF
jgi:Gluconate 2-dehydrogenase subunit 3